MTSKQFYDPANCKDRPFPVVMKRFDPSQPARRVRTLQCSRCPRTEDVFDNGISPLPSDTVRKKFTQKNWEVGKAPEHDLCPDCIDADRNKRRRNLALVKPLLDFPAQSLQLQGAKMAMATADDAPRAMDPDDRRLIFTKLNDVWAGKDVGYVVPWTDQAVAKDLGVPFGWVAEVRSQFFGEAKDNSEIREMLSEARAVLEKIEARAKEADQLRKDGADLIIRANTLNGSLVELRRTAEHLAHIAARIEKAIK